MAYEKQTWHTGDVITEGKLNHMEDGIAGAGALVIHRIASETPPEWVNDDTMEQLGGSYGGYYYDITPAQVSAAFTAGKNIIVLHEETDGTPIPTATSYGIPRFFGGENPYIQLTEYGFSYITCGGDPDTFDYYPDSVGNEVFCSLDANGYYAVIITIG